MRGQLSIKPPLSSPPPPPPGIINPHSHSQMNRFFLALRSYTFSAGDWWAPPALWPAPITPRALRSPWCLFRFSRLPFALRSPWFLLGPHCSSALPCGHCAPPPLFAWRCSPAVAPCSYVLVWSSPFRPAPHAVVPWCPPAVAPVV